MNKITSRHYRQRPVGKGMAIGVVAAAALAATALWVAQRARRAEQEHPPRGAFLKVDGVRLHYLDRGEGTPVILLHGNAVRLEDWVVSGIIDRLAERHRVIAFDRPGYGHSERPRNRLWTPAAQARLLQKTFAQLRISRPVVVGQSQGAQVALALALDPDAAVRHLILVSGYFFPSFRLDAAMVAPVALPVLGDVMRYTVSAVEARLMLKPMVKTMFHPQHVPEGYLETLSREMLVRPAQLRADTQDGVFMIPSAASLRKRYADLNVPTSIIAGEDDKVIDPASQSGRLHSELRDSTLRTFPRVGHMAHHAVVDELIALIDQAAGTQAQASTPAMAGRDAARGDGAASYRSTAT